MRRREGDHDQARGVPGRQRRSFRSDRVQDGDEIPRVDLTAAIASITPRGAQAPALEPHRPAERAQPSGDPDARVVPEKLQGTGESAMQDEVERAAATHQVGQARPISRTGEMGLGNVAHRRKV